MFYEAMVADGVSVELAQKMYTAVRLFGPHWTVPVARGAGEAPKAAPRELTIDELEAALDAALGE